MEIKHKTSTYDLIRVIFLCLSNAMNKRNNQIYSISEITKITNLDRNSLARHIKELEDLKIIDSFFVGNRKYYTLDKTIKNKIEISGKEYLSDLMVRTELYKNYLKSDE